jgi:hypothetical protein
MHELEGMRSDRSHSNYNGAQVTGVEKRGVEQDPDEDPETSGGSGREDVRGGCTGGVGRGSGSSTSWAAGVKPLAFGQYGELGPGFEQLLDQLAEEGAARSGPRFAPLSFVSAACCLPVTRT